MKSGIEYLEKQIKLILYKLIGIFISMVSIQVSAQLSPSQIKKANHYFINNSDLGIANPQNFDSLLTKILEARDSANDTKSLLSIQAYCGNHYNTFGRTYGVNQLAFGTVLTFEHRSGFSIYTGEESWGSQGVSPEFFYPGIGFTSELNSWLDFNSSLEHWFFLNTDNFSKRILNNYLQSSVDIYVGNFTQSILASITWGKKNAYQFESNTNYTLEKYSMWGFDKVSFVPEILIDIGTPNSIWQGYRKIKVKSGKHVAPETSVYNAKGIYLLSSQLGLPVTFNRKKNELCFAVYFIKPFNAFKGESLKPLIWFQGSYTLYLFR